MRLHLKLLSADSSVNQLKEIKQLKIAKGETTDLVFQLVDLDQGGQRYMPAAGATLQVSIPRNPSVIPDDTGVNLRSTVDHSINRAAAQAFAQDASIFRLPLLAQDTQTMTSTNVKVTLTEGSNVKIATLTQAIKIIDDQDL